MEETDIRKFEGKRLPARPDVVVIDSIQTMFVDSLDSAPGTVAQVRASTHELIRAREEGGAVLGAAEALGMEEASEWQGAHVSRADSPPRPARR